MAESFLLILAIILMLVLLVFGSKIQRMLVAYAPIVSVITEGILKIRMLILFFVLIVFLCLSIKSFRTGRQPFGASS